MHSRTFAQGICFFLLALVSVDNASYASPIAVTAVILSEQERIESIQFLGMIEAKNIALVQAKTPGTINNIYYFPGDKVAAGELLLRLDDTAQKIKLDVALQVFAKAQAVYNLETFNYNRAKVLYANHAISESDYQVQTANYQSTTSAFHNAQSNLDLARLELSYTGVFSPISGTISQKKVLENSVVGIGTPLFVVTSIKKLSAIIPVPEHICNQLSLGLPVQLKNLSSQSLIKAHITGIDATVNQSTHSRNVYANFDNPGGWHPGNTIEATFLLPKSKGFSVPQQAVVFQSGSAQVFVINNNHVRALNVEETITNGKNVWIRGALKNGMKIVSTGAGNIFNGAEVSIKEEP